MFNWKAENEEKKQFVTVGEGDGQHVIPVDYMDNKTILSDEHLVSKSQDYNTYMIKAKRNGEMEQYIHKFKNPKKLLSFGGIPDYINNVTGKDNFGADKDSSLYIEYKDGSHFYSVSGEETFDKFKRIGIESIYFDDGYDVYTYGDIDLYLDKEGLLRTKSKKAINQILLDDKVGGKGRRFETRFLQAGLVKYSFGVCLLEKETIDKFIYNFVGCPVIINHKEVTNKSAKDDRVGVISRVWFNERDGWYWGEGVIFEQNALDLIDKGYNVSCQYEITEYSSNGGIHNGNVYDKTILNGKPEHLAIVKNPRYENAMIAVNAIEAANFNPNHGKDGRFASGYSFRRDFSELDGELIYLDNNDGIEVGYLAYREDNDSIVIDYLKKYDEYKDSEHRVSDRLILQLFEMFPNKSVVWDCVTRESEFARRSFVNKHPELASKVSGLWFDEVKAQFEKDEENKGDVDKAKGEIKMATNENGRWITVKGTRVFVKQGETIEQAIKKLPKSSPADPKDKEKSELRGKYEREDADFDVEQMKKDVESAKELGYDSIEDIAEFLGLDEDEVREVAMADKEQSKYSDGKLKGEIRALEDEIDDIDDKLQELDNKLRKSEKAVDKYSRDKAKGYREDIKSLEAKRDKKNKQLNDLLEVKEKKKAKNSIIEAINEIKETSMFKHLFKKKEQNMDRDEIKSIMMECLTELTASNEVEKDVVEKEKEKEVAENKCKNEEPDYKKMYEDLKAECEAKKEKAKNEIEAQKEVISGGVVKASNGYITEKRAIELGKELF